MIVTLMVTAAVVFTPLAFVIALVSLASRHEDSAWTLTGPASGPLQAAARHVFGFYCTGIVDRGQRPSGQ